MKSISDMNLAEVTLSILGAAVNIPDGMYSRAQYLAKEDLRALLDDPEKDYVLINGMYFSHAEILEWREKACADMEKAAQYQGEPVGYVIESHLAALIAGEETSVEAYRLPSDGSVVSKRIPVFAEQPAPVVVVMPERDPLDDPDDENVYEESYAKGWNEALSEVARLNGVKP